MLADWTSPVSGFPTGNEPDHSTHGGLYEHPKDTLYRVVYDPLTLAWFKALTASGGAAVLVGAASTRGLLNTLLDLNTLFHDLVDHVFTKRLVNVDAMVAAVSKYRDFVLWEGHAVPSPGADESEILTSLGEKIKRNISLGVIEALICLRSATDFGARKLSLTGAKLEAMVRRSRRLYMSLAVLHDNHEQARVKFLANLDGYVQYPYVDYGHVLDRTVAISFEYFLVGGGPDRPQLRFVRVPPEVEADTPLKRCPAHRFRTEEGPGSRGRPLNDVLWDTLVDVFRETGEFAV